MSIGPYTATIEAATDGQAIADLFAAEQKGAKAERSAYTIAKQGNGVVFTITAKDSVALRATMNSITKLLTVYEKAKEI